MFRCHTLALVLGSVSSSFALPQYELPEDVSFNKVTVEEYCNEYAGGFPDVDTFRRFWDESGAGPLVDGIATGHQAAFPVRIDGVVQELQGPKFPDGPVDWLWHLQDWVWPDGDIDNVEGCQNVEGDCHPGPGWECREYLSKWEDSDDPVLRMHGKAAYWVFRASYRMHERIKAIDAELFKDVVIEGLKIDQMVSDLGERPEVFNAAEAIGSAFGIASGPVGELNPGVGGVLGLLGDAIAMIPAADQPEEIEGTLAAFLSDSYNTTYRSLGVLTKLASGYDDNPDNYDNLPALGEYGSSKLSRFMSSYIPWLDYSSDEIREGLTSMGLRLRTRMADFTMAAAGWRLHHWETDDVKYCASVPGHQHIEYRGWKICAHLGRPPRGDGKPAEPTPDFYNKMIEYGLWNRHEYYVSLLDCVYGSDRIEDRNGVAFIGELPKCHYRMPLALGRPCVDSVQNACVSEDVPDGVKLSSGLEHCAKMNGRDVCGPTTE